MNDIWNGRMLIHDKYQPVVLIVRRGDKGILFDLAGGGDLENRWCIATIELDGKFYFPFPDSLKIDLYQQRCLETNEWVPLTDQRIEFSGVKWSIPKCNAGCRCCCWGGNLHFTFDRVEATGFILADDIQQIGEK